MGGLSCRSHDLVDSVWISSPLQQVDGLLYASGGHIAMKEVPHLGALWPFRASLFERFQEVARLVIARLYGPGFLRRERRGSVPAVQFY